MKTRILVSLVASLVLFALLVPAQAPQGRRGREGANAGNGAQMREHMIDRLVQELNLTDAQKTQATTIFTDAFQAERPIQQQIRTTRESLQAAVKSNNTAQIDQISTSLGTLMGQLTAVQSKAEAQFYAILTPDQQAKVPNRPLFGGMGGPGGRRPGNPQ